MASHQSKKLCLVALLDPYSERSDLQLVEKSNMYRDIEVKSDLILLLFLKISKIREID